jgi:hypothetical protein
VSQPDLVTQLREARPAAPPEVRERVRLIAAQAPPARRRLSWKRALLVAAPVVAAAVVAAVVIPRGQRHATPTAVPVAPIERKAAAPVATGAPATAAQGSADHAVAPTAPTPSAKRLQSYSASLSLRVKNATAVSDLTKQTVKIAQSLGGFPQSVNVSAGGKTGYANIVLRVPRTRVQEAVSRLSALGTILNESVSVKDLQAGANATDRLIGRLQRQLTALRTQPQTPETARQLSALTARIQRLQRRQAATARAARYATVSLQLTTREPVAAPQHGHGPLHGLGVAFRWIGIGALYGLALGGPLVLLSAGAWLATRRTRRRREERLLSRS